MILSCPITQISFQYAGFDGPKPIAALHPIFNLPPRALWYLASTTPELSTRESALLWLALFKRLPIASIKGPIPLTLLSHTFCVQSLPLILQLSQSSESLLSALPSFILSAESLEAGALHNWLDLVRDGILYGRAAPTNEPSTYAEEFLLAHAGLRKKAASNARSTWQWALDQMLLRCPGFSDNGFRYLSAMLFEAKGSSLDYMQDLKGRCLDYLPESNADQSYRKALVIERMDSCLLASLQIAAALGMASPQLTEAAQQIASTYTIHAPDGTAHPNSASMVAKNAVSLTTLQAIAPASERKQYTPSQIASNKLLQALAAQGLLK